MGIHSRAESPDGEILSGPSAALTSQGILSHLSPAHQCYQHRRRIHCRREVNRSTPLAMGGSLHTDSHISPKAKRGRMDSRIHAKTLRGLQIPLACRSSILRLCLPPLSGSTRTHRNTLPPISHRNHQTLHMAPHQIARREWVERSGTVTTSGYSGKTRSGSERPPAI